MQHASVSPHATSLATKPSRLTHNKKLPKQPTNNNITTQPLVLTYQHTMKTTSLLVLALATTVSAFGSFGGKKATPKSTLPLPTFDDATQRYIKNPNDDGVLPYDAVGAALRHGPVPFFTRIFNADEYEQGVLKYMGTAKVSRAEAVGNMDAKLNNPMGKSLSKLLIILLSLHSQNSQYTSLLSP